MLGCGPCRHDPDRDRPVSVDPRALAANLELFVNYYGTDPGVPMSAVDGAAAGAAFIRSMVPLHDAWLKANPPCRGLCKRGFIGAAGNTFHCPDCTDHPGVQPFDKWTAGLAALWTEVTEAWLGEQTHDAVYYAVERIFRQIGRVAT